MQHRGAAELAAPRLPKEMRGPRRTLRQTLPKCTTKQRARIAHALAEELAALHADGTVVGRLSPDTVTFGMTGYPEIGEIGPAHRESPYTAKELRRANGGWPTSTTRADSYALGALVFFILTGCEPPTEWTLPELARLSPTAAAIVARCVADDPWGRPEVQDVAHMIEEAGPEGLRSDGLSHPIDLIRAKGQGPWNVAPVVALTGTAALLVLAGTMTTALGAVGVAAMLLGASITFGASF